MTRFEVLTLFIGLLAVVVSVVSLVGSRRLDERQERLREKQDELTELQLHLLRREVEEQTRRDVLPAADVRVTLERSLRGERFVIINWGYGAARNVDVTIQPREGRTSPLVEGDYDEKLPIPELLPGARVVLIAGLSFGTGIAFDAVLTWVNADGSEQRREVELSLM
jgi:hypothetical protein